VDFTLMVCVPVPYFLKTGGRSMYRRKETRSEALWPNVLLMVAMAILWSGSFALAGSPGKEMVSSVGDFLAAGGRFDLEAARRSGFRGALDRSGFGMHVDPATGAPIFRPEHGEVSKSRNTLEWFDGFGPHGGVTLTGVQGPVPGEVNALAVFFDPSLGGEVLIVGGFFDKAGGVPANSIAAWDGLTWRAMGFGPTNGVRKDGWLGTVWAFAIHDDGERLIVGGDFDQAGNAFIDNVACWSNSAWSSLGVGLNAAVLALASDGTFIYAGGQFEEPHVPGELPTWAYIARCDQANNWTGLGGQSPDGIVYSLNLNEGGNSLPTGLYVGGIFSMAGTLPVGNIARWNQGTWYALGSGSPPGTDGEVSSLAIFDDKLFAGGWFTMVDGQSLPYLAAWDGVSWQDPGFIPAGYLGIEAMTVHYDSYLGQDVLICGGSQENALSLWDGAASSEIRLSDSSGGVRALATFEDNLIVGGTFSDFVYNPGTSLARWHDEGGWDPTLGREGWIPWGLGLDGRVNAVIMYGDRVIVGGDFVYAGGTLVNHIAAWDGNAWSTIGHPDAPGLNGPVEAFLTLMGDLYIGGDFTANAPEDPEPMVLNYICRWDGTAWSPVGGGMDGPVEALTVYRGEIIAGGAFEYAGGTLARHIARWDFTTWQPLHQTGGGQTCGMPLGGYVHALETYEDLAAGEHLLYAGGEFRQVEPELGDPIQAFHIASWNGVTQTWSAVGPGLESSVWAMEVFYNEHQHCNELIGGGTFWATDQQGTVLRRIGRWNGTTWKPLGPTGSGVRGGEAPAVYALEYHWPFLFIGGRFTEVGDIMGHTGTVQVSNLTTWNGIDWDGDLGWDAVDLGGGIGDGHAGCVPGMGPVWALAGTTSMPGAPCRIMVGGCFSEADDLLSACIASWDQAGFGDWGACCLNGGKRAQCVIATCDECDAMGGTFMGEGVHCDPSPCDPNPTPSFLLEQSLPGIANSDAQWGDIDNDGDLDLAVAGNSDDGPVTTIYLNQAGSLVLNQDLIGIQSTGSGCLSWGDLDGDGFLDLAVAGATDSLRIAKIYVNDGTGSLAWDTQQVLTGVSGAATAWGDYDSDGDLDLVVCGHDGTQPVSTLYRNHPLGVLSPVPTQPLVGLYSGSADWVDFDRDGDLDLMLTGFDGSDRRTVFYVNDPLGILNAEGANGLPGVYRAAGAWGDYDNDGDLDLVRTGETATGGPSLARVYANDGTGNLTAMADLLNVYRSSCAWGDYDNDGDLDVGVCGYDGGSGWFTFLFENTGGGTFVQDITLPGVREGSLSWADVDNDGDLDFLATGDHPAGKHADLFISSGGLPNTLPSTPANLDFDFTNGLHLSWEPASDLETPWLGMYYCVRVGTAPGGNDIMSGTYGSPLMGNSRRTNDLVLDLQTGEYYLSVRAIDTGFATSAWAAEVFTGVTPVFPDTPDDLPTCYTLAPNKPNPFNPFTTISYGIPREGQVSLVIFDVAGRFVRTLVNTWQGPGKYSVRWDGRDDAGRAVGSGVYFYRMSAGEEIFTGKMALLK